MRSGLLYASIFFWFIFIGGFVFIQSATMNLF